MLKKHLHVHKTGPQLFLILVENPYRILVQLLVATCTFHMHLVE